MADSPGFRGEALKRYWTAGAGGIKIGWNTPGDFTRCVRLVKQAAGSDMTTEQVKGYCAELHHRATGMWPGDKRNIGKK